MPNVMVALPNIDGVRCSTPQFGWRPLLDCRAVTPLKLAGVPQTGKPISAASGPKFTILWGHLEEVLLLNTFFLIVATCLRCEDIARQICGMVRTTFQTCILNLHQGHTMCQSMVDIQPAAAEIRRGKEKDRRKETTEQKYNAPPITLGSHN